MELAAELTRRALYQAGTWALVKGFYFKLP